MSPLERFWSAPPISRTLAAVAFSFSLLIYTGVIPFGAFDLSIPPLIKLPPELWRIVTPLMMTGRSLGIIFDTYFLYVYGVKLEIASPRFSQRADFATYICFISTVIILLNIFITSGHVLATALALAFVTTSTRDSWDQPMTLVILKMPSQYLPYALLLFTLICASPEAAMIQGTGLIAAYTYDLLTGLYPKSGIKENWILTPPWMKKLFGTQLVVERPYGTVFAPATWGVDMSWKRFGAGRTLDGRTVGVEGESSTEESGRPTGLKLAASVFVVFLVLSALLVFFFTPKLEGPFVLFSGVDVNKLAPGSQPPGTTLGPAST